MSDRMTDEEREAVEATRERRKKVAETKSQPKQSDKSGSKSSDK